MHETVHDLVVAHSGFRPRRDEQCVVTISRRDRSTRRNHNSDTACRGGTDLCKAANDGTLSWQFREPIATLLLDDKTVGRHYAGPSWEYSDGSAVTGKALASAPGATPLDIPWLKLEVATRRGSGTLANVTTIQRLNTHGGAVRGPCEQAGSFRSAPYAADYVFLRKGSP